MKTLTRACRGATLIKRVLFVLLGSILLANFAMALPPRQHLARGTIAAIGPDEIVLAPTSAAKDAPTVFAIKQGRTRLRENGRKVPLEALKIGSLVRVYYRKEMGVWTATEVTWSPASPQDPRNR